MTTSQGSNLERAFCIWYFFSFFDYFIKRTTATADNNNYGSPQLEYTIYFCANSSQCHPRHSIRYIVCYIAKAKQRTIF